MPSKPSASAPVPKRQLLLDPADRAKLLELRALFVKAATLDQEGRIFHVEFFPPDVVQSAILAQMTKEVTPALDVSGQSDRVMDLRAKIRPAMTQINNRL